MPSVMSTSVLLGKNSTTLRPILRSALVAIGHVPKIVITVRSKPNVPLASRGEACAAAWRKTRWIGCVPMPQPKPTQKALRKRSVWVEPLFAEVKQWHGMRRFRLRLLWRVNCEALLIAAGQNLKRLLSKRGWGRRPCPAEALCVLFLAAFGWVLRLFWRSGLFFLPIDSDY
jgi:hypothetical protein